MWVAQPWPPYFSVKYSRLGCGRTFKGAGSPQNMTNVAHAYTHIQRSRNRLTTSARLVCWPIISTPICAYIHTKVNCKRKQMESKRQTERWTSVCMTQFQGLKVVSLLLFFLVKFWFYDSFLDSCPVFRLEWLPTKKWRNTKDPVYEI